MRTLFWKVFLILSLAQVCLILVVAALLNFQYEQRFSMLELRGNFQPLADFVVAHYEKGVDTSGSEFRTRENSVSIYSLDDRDMIYGRRWGSPENRVTWDFESESGHAYRVNVQIPPRSRWLPDILDTYPMVGAVATVLMFSWLMTFLLTRPIRRLQTHVQALAGGDLDSRLDGGLTNRRDEIGDLATALDEMSDRIQTLLESKQRLLYDVSHELRAPLARMQVAAEMVRVQAEEHGDDSALHDRVSYEIDALNQIISQLLQLARNESEAVQPDETGLRDPINEVVENMRFSWPNRQIRLQFEGAHQTYRYQSIMLCSAVKNILENSLKYSPVDEVIEIDVVEEVDGQTILIRDCGSGIPDDKLESMFQPFTRMQAESIEGFGLGLSIARRAIETLGGSIILSNHADGGLVAKIYLSLEVVQA
jgi:two-component system, OmpR family, sensor kinase